MDNGTSSQSHRQPSEKAPLDGTALPVIGSRHRKLQ